MRITVNEELREVPEDCDLATALNEVGLDSSDGWAVAVNEEVVPAEGWENCKLTRDDSVLLVRATQGG